MHPTGTVDASRSKRLWHYGLGGVAALALFIATSWWPDTPDGLIHLHRSRALAEALQMGVIFPRLFPDFAFGYGYPVFNFYTPLFYYPPALLHLLGVDLLVATRLALALGFGTSAVGMMALVRQWGGIGAALVATIFFLVFPYRLYDLFVRGALPEFAAFVWLPWLALTTVALLRATVEQQPGWELAATRWAIGSALLWAALLLSHNHIALLVALAGVGVAILLLTRAAAQRQLPRCCAPLLWSALAFGAGSLLAGWFVLPALLEAGWVEIGAHETQGYLNHFATWNTLFRWRFPYLYPAAAEAVVPLPGVVAVLAVAALALFGSARPGQPRPLLLAVVATLLSAIFLTTALSAPLWRLLAIILSRLQFPWRWQIIVTFAAALLLGLVVQQATRAFGRNRALLSAGLLAVVLLTLCLGGLQWSVLPASTLDFGREAMLRLDAATEQVGASWTAEFLPIWVTEQRWAIGREPSEPQVMPAQPVQTTATLRRAGYLHAEYEVSAPVAWSVTFHRFHYPAWQVHVDGTRMESAPVTTLGLPRAPLAEGTYTLRLKWSATTAVWLGRVATAVGWGMIGVLLLRAHRLHAQRYGRRWQWSGAALALWLGTALFGVVAASGVTARDYPVQAQQADFGVVHLAGVIAPPAQRGAVAPVTLHWLVREGGSDLITFIHVLNANGEIVAQEDGPLGGTYTPASRLLPGQLLDPTYGIPLPADLPAAEYQLRIGVYPPGSPQSPLAPAGSDVPFVTDARLEVRP